MSELTRREGSMLIDTVPKRCPFVLLGLKKALKAAASGELLAVRTIDPQAFEDIRRYCQASALSFEGSDPAEGAILIYVRKADDASRSEP
jgi:TusA-related sulfurtransferase